MKVRSATLRVMAAVMTACLLVAAANYYLELGWLGDRPRLVLSVTLLMAAVLLLVAMRTWEGNQ